MNMVSVASGYVWEKELACWNCHRVFSDAASTAYQIPINVDSHERTRISRTSKHQH